MHRLISFFTISMWLSGIAFSAELSESSEVYENVLPDYFERSDVVALGYFEIPDNQRPSDGLGKSSDYWLLNFHQLETIKPMTNGSNTISVRVRNDILPYLDWNISRKDLRELKEQAYAKLVSRYSETSEVLEAENELGNISDAELAEFNNQSDEALLNTVGTTIQYTPRRTNSNTPDRLIKPRETYLVFLSRNGESYDLIDESMGFNLFFGLDAILFARILREL